MRDIFPAPSSIIRLATPLSNVLALRTLPYHIHEILPAFAFYHVLDLYISPFLTRLVFPNIYASFPERTRKNWNAHVVSLVQSTVINTAAIWVIIYDRERSAMGPTERVWGYTGAMGFTQALSAGYFLWDLMASSLRPDIHTYGSVAHAAAALAVSVLGFRPFCNYYGINFVLYELSTPFLNFHWFMDKLGLTGSLAQFINGIILISSFGMARLVWGTYQNVHMYADIYGAWQAEGKGLPVPAWLAGMYMLSSAVLTGLNVWWFGKMVSALMSRFDKDEGKGKKTE